MMKRGVGEVIVDFVRRIEVTVDRCRRCEGDCCDEIAVVFTQRNTANQTIDVQRLTGDIARSFLDTVPYRGSR